MMKNFVGDGMVIGRLEDIRVQLYNIETKIKCKKMYYNFNDKLPKIYKRIVDDIGVLNFAREYLYVFPESFSDITAILDWWDDSIYTYRLFLFISKTDQEQVIERLCKENTSFKKMWTATDEDLKMWIDCLLQDIKFSCVVKGGDNLKSCKNVEIIFKKEMKNEIVKLLNMTLK